MKKTRKHLKNLIFEKRSVINMIVIVFFCFNIFIFLGTAFSIGKATKESHLESEFERLQTKVNELEERMNIRNRDTELQEQIWELETLLGNDVDEEYEEITEIAKIDVTADENQTYFVVIYGGYPTIEAELYGLGEHANVGPSDLLTEDEEVFYFAVSSIPVECYDIHNTGRCDTFESVIKESNDDLARYGGIWRFDRNSHDFEHIVTMSNLSDVGVDPGYFLEIKIRKGVISFKGFGGDDGVRVFYSTKTGELTTLN